MKGRKGWSEAREQFVKAYELIDSSTDSDLKESIYIWISYASLYLEDPGGYEGAIKFGTEYVNEPTNKPSGAIWVNLAAGYGRKARWLRDHVGSEEEQKKARSDALNAIQNALKINPIWISKLKELMVSGGDKDPEENDLEAFERDPEFRKVLKLD